MSLVSCNGGGDGVDLGKVASQKNESKVQKFLDKNRKNLQQIVVGERWIQTQASENSESECSEYVTTNFQIVSVDELSVQLHAKRSGRLLN